MGFTDLKKTMAVLLESMLERLSRLEVQVHQVINMSNSSIVNLTLPQMTDQTDDSLHAEGMGKQHIGHECCYTVTYS